ncbi:MAG TPA: hypothetical protein PLQ13_05460 [Candidatus Krumholzibacteria bacterium]|nr:hypothetical protein [Candidatus Krumholzibacteria bacterium]
MTDTLDLLRRVEALAERRGVFRPEAYVFVLEALELAVANQDEPGHVSGEDVLERIRLLGRDRFGALAGDVFNAWGVRGTIDFGRIVFHLVDDGLLHKRDEDTLADFIDKFDFRQAFALRTHEGRG